MTGIGGRIDLTYNIIDMRRDRNLSGSCFFALKDRNAALNEAVVFKGWTNAKAKKWAVA